jgi:hypothetical protein
MGSQSLRKGELIVFSWLYVIDPVYLIAQVIGAFAAFFGRWSAFARFICYSGGRSAFLGALRTECKPYSYKRSEEEYGGNAAEYYFFVFCHLCFSFP